MRTLSKRILSLAAATLVFAAARAEAAAGMRTPFGEVIVRNLKIGQTYSLYKLVNLPLRLVNTGDEEVNLSIEPIPAKIDGEHAGYDPVPSLDWVRVTQSSFTVAPNHEVATDVIITIPNDPKLLGRRFEADIWSHTSSVFGSVGVGIVSKLLLLIDSTPPTEEELKKKYVDERVADLDFTVLPSEVDLGTIPLGRPIGVREDRRLSIKLINPNDRALDFRIRSIPVWESLIVSPPGYEPAYDSQWLKPDQGVVRLEGNSIGHADLTLEVPDEPRVRGRKLMFIVSVEVLEQKIPTHVYFRLRATMPPAPAAKPGK